MKDLLENFISNKALAGKEKARTWFIDIDGTVFRYEGYKGAPDVLLEGAKEFFEWLPEEDTVILTTSRDNGQRWSTEKALKENKIRYDCIIFGLPAGERFLVNDYVEEAKPTAYGVNVARNSTGKGSFLQVLSDGNVI